MKASMNNQNVKGIFAKISKFIRHFSSMLMLGLVLTTGMLLCGASVIGADVIIEDGTLKVSNIMIKDSHDKERYYEIVGGDYKAGTFSVWDSKKGYTLTMEGSNVGIGTTNPKHLLHVKGSATPARIERTTGSINNADDVLEMLRTTSGDMVDGFGSLFRWTIQDNAGQRRIVGQIGAIRDGGDREGALVFQAGHDGTEEFMRIDNDGNVGIGTMNPAFALDVVGTVYAHEFVETSDIRLKTNVTPLTNVIEKLAKVRGVSFAWRDRERLRERSTERKEIGVLAHEVETVFPELVTTRGDTGYKGVDYGGLTAVILEAVKELKAKKDSEIAVLKAENTAHQQRIVELEARLSVLEQKAKSANEVAASRR